jgi:uncharacterized protein with PIN domain
MMSGTFVDDRWQKTDEIECPVCDAHVVEFKRWESDDGSHEDMYCRCRNCAQTWWAEGFGT